MQREDGIGEGIVIEEEFPEWGSLSCDVCGKSNQQSRRKREGSDTYTSIAENDDGRRQVRG